MKIEEAKLDPRFSVMPLILADVISTSGSFPVTPQEPGQDYQEAEDD